MNVIRRKLKAPEFNLPIVLSEKQIVRIVKNNFKEDFASVMEVSHIFHTNTICCVYDNANRARIIYVERDENGKFNESESEDFGDILSFLYSMVEYQRKAKKNWFKKNQDIIYAKY